METVFSKFVIISLLNTKDLFNPHLLDLFEVSDMAAQSDWHAPPLTYLSNYSPDVSPLLVPLPLIILRALLVTIFWESCPCRGSTCIVRGVMPKSLFLAQTSLLSSTPACWKSPPEWYVSTSNSVGLLRTLLSYADALPIITCSHYVYTCIFLIRLQVLRAVTLIHLYLLSSTALCS